MTSETRELPDLGGPALRPWREGERESFFEAIARHRKAAWRITAVCELAWVALALVAAVLLAPLLYCLLGLALDVVNFVVPTPDVWRFSEYAINKAQTLSPALAAVWILVLAILPTLPVIAGAMQTLNGAF